MSRHEATPEDVIQDLGVQVLTGGGLNVSSLSLLGRDSKIILGGTGMVYALTCDKQGNFAITYDDESQFYIEKNGNIHVDGKLFCEGGVQLNGQLQLMGEWGASAPQFFLGSIELFTADYCLRGQVNGKWTNCTTTPCGGKYLLGGYGAFSNGETSKTYRGLALHSQIRLVFTFMFLDGWEGETAYAKVDGHYVWSESYDHKTSKSGINICGAPAAESKFGVPVDVIVPHNKTSITITFGSNLEFSPFEASWGISDVEMLYA